MFWALPPGCMTGILNGLEDNARPRLAGLGGAHSGGGEEGAVDLDTFFARKLQAKLGFQAAKGLQVGGASLRESSSAEWPVVSFIAPEPPRPADSCPPAPCRWAPSTACWSSWGASPTRRGATSLRWRHATSCTAAAPRRWASRGRHQLVLSGCLRLATAGESRVRTRAAGTALRGLTRLGKAAGDPPRHRCAHTDCHGGAHRG